MNRGVNEQACSRCWLRESCIPAAQTQIEWDQVDRLVVARRRIRRKEALFRSGERLTSLYAVRTGVIKLCMTTRDGREQVSAFQRAGEVIGLDGIDRERYVTDAVALEDSVVCEIPLESMEAMAREIPTLQRRIYQVMSREIIREQNMMLLLGNPRATERVAGFLLDSSLAQRPEGSPLGECILRMTRQDIAACLALTMETVSRTLWRFESEGLIEISKRDVKIVNPDALRRLVNSRSVAYEAAEAARIARPVSPLDYPAAA